MDCCLNSTISDRKMVMLQFARPAHAYKISHGIAANEDSTIFMLNPGQLRERSKALIIEVLKNVFLAKLIVPTARNPPSRTVFMKTSNAQQGISPDHAKGVSPGSSAGRRRQWYGLLLLEDRRSATRLEPREPSARSFSSSRRCGGVRRSR